MDKGYTTSDSGNEMDEIVRETVFMQLDELQESIRLFNCFENTAGEIEFKRCMPLEVAD